MTDKQILEAAVEAAQQTNALILGSPDAIADCQQRRISAIAHAQRVIDADDVAARLVNGAASDGWEWVDEEGDTDGH